MPRLFVDRDFGGRPTTGREHLLAVQWLRRDLERLSTVGRAEQETATAVSTTDLTRELEELIAALDRRVPRIEYAGEAAIARDAAALRAKAIDRLAELADHPAVRNPNDRREQT